MIYEYKLIPLNRRTGEPAFTPGNIKPQFAIDIDELWKVLSAVNPASSQGVLVAAVMTEERDKQALTGSTAQALSEMFGADVYYREYREGGEGAWTKQPSVWRPKR